MKRLAIATALITLGLPGSALAHAGGIVLSAQGRAVQVIGKSHAVRSFRVVGTMPALHPGSRINFQSSGSKISNVRAHGRATHVTFAGIVSRVGAGAVVVRLGDGKTATVRRPQVRPASHTLSRNDVVLVTEPVARGGRATITAVGPAGRTSGSGSGGGSGALQAFGTVVEINPTWFVLQTGSGDLTFNITPAQLYDAQLSLCNVVSVAYSSGDMNVDATDLDIAYNDSTAGKCADPGPPSFNGTMDVIGPITELNLSTVTVQTPSGPMTFGATIDLTTGYLVGDTVDVTYEQTKGGSLLASDIVPDDYDAIGKVTAVSAGSVTIVDSGSGTSRTFTDDPSNGTFDGISVGDTVDVSWYYSNGHVVVDYVTDVTSSF